MTGGDAAVPPASTPLPEPWAQGVEAGRVERAGYRAGPGPAEPYALTPGPIDESGDVGSPVDPTRQAGSGATPDSWGSVPRPVLHFDATDDLPAFEGSSNRADGGPYQPDGSPRSRSARDRSRTQSHRRAPTFRSSRRSGRRWAAAAVAAAVLIVAGVVGFTLVGGTGSPRHHSALNPQTTTTRPAPAPVVPARTTPTTTPTTAILVASSAGSSTYRVGASATITLAAGNGTCWVEIRQAGPYGPVLFTGDLLAGQTRDMNGPVWVRLGNPGAIAVTVNGTSISPPGMTTGEPYDLQFA